MTAGLSRIPVAWWQRAGLLLLVLWLSASLARLAWLLAAQPSDFVARGQSVNLPLLAHSEVGSAVDIEALAQLNPFGQALAEPEPVAAAPSIEQDAQETRLQLQLQGVFAADDGTGQAIIANGANQSLYSVGSALPGGANVKLSKVLADRVVIENNGRYELLWLYDEASRTAPVPQAAPEPEPAAAVEARVDRTMVTRMAQDQALSAESLQDVVKVSFKRAGGKFVGLEVRPGRDRQVFDAAGLRAGDIVTAVNGVSMADPAAAQGMMHTLQTARSVSLTLLRDGQEENLDISLE